MELSEKQLRVASWFFHVWTGLGIIVALALMSQLSLNPNGDDFQDAVWEYAEGYARLVADSNPAVVP